MGGKVPTLQKKGCDMMKGIMILGTASNVGKSLIATAFCRMLRNRGMRAAPFKAQNMTSNTRLTADGLEIAASQVIQAEAAQTKVTKWMNPIVLKPNIDGKAQTVVQGKPVGSLPREAFYETGLAAVKESLTHLEKAYDVVVMEGAGSPVELNLKKFDLVNMKVAELADVPVVLVADVDRGGVFASVVGTLALMTPVERERVKGVVINRFHGDPALFQDGVRLLEERTGVPVLGVLPLVSHSIEDEDLPPDDFSGKRLSDATNDGQYNDWAQVVEEHLDWDNPFLTTFFSKV